MPKAPIIRSIALRTAALALLVPATGIGLAASLAGCSTPPPVDQSGPPPEGFETWEDYWHAQDQQNRDFQTDIQRARMRRPPSVVQ